MNKLATVSLQGKDYALVPTRLKEFREKNPRADIVTTPTFQDDGSLMFKARITQDQGDPNSAKGTGHARYTATQMEAPKAFEKLETIAKGRALADLGYLNNGEIATTEEMLEFEAYKLDKVEDAIEAINKAEKRGEFEEILSGLSAEQQKQVVPVIQERMKELKNAVATK